MAWHATRPNPKPVPAPCDPYIQPSPHPPPAQSAGCEHVFRARGATFACMTLLLLLHAYNCKDLSRSLLRINYRDNLALMGAVALGVVTLIPTFYVPVLYTKVFYQAPLDWEWGLVLGSCLLFLLAAEAYKACLRPRVVAWERREAGRRARGHSCPPSVVGIDGLELVVISSGHGPTAPEGDEAAAATAEVVPGGCCDGHVVARAMEREGQ